MAFEGLTEKLNKVFKNLRSRGRLTESDVKAAMREIRMALLEADVNFRVVKDFIARVSEKAVGEDILESLSPCAAGHQNRQRRAVCPDGRRAEPHSHGQLAADGHHVCRPARRG